MTRPIEPCALERWLQRLPRGVVIVLLFAVFITAAVLCSACDQTVAAPETKTDTVVVLKPDTSVVTKVDTLVRTDTLVKVDTALKVDTTIRVDTVTKLQVKTVVDTITQVVTVTKIDTTVTYDTIVKVPPPVIDTVIRVDTVLRPDTVTRYDTITQVDTLHLVDTVTHIDTLQLVDTLVLVRTDSLFLPGPTVHDTVVQHDTTFTYLPSEPTNPFWMSGDSSAAISWQPGGWWGFAVVYYHGLFVGTVDPIDTLMVDTTIVGGGAPDSAGVSIVLMTVDTLMWRSFAYAHTPGFADIEPLQLNGYYATFADAVHSLVPLSVVIPVGLQYGPLMSRRPAMSPHVRTGPWRRVAPPHSAQFTARLRSTITALRRSPWTAHVNP